MAQKIPNKTCHMCSEELLSVLELHEHIGKMHAYSFLKHKNIVKFQYHMYMHTYNTRSSIGPIKYFTFHL